MTAALGSETFPTYVDVDEQVKPFLQFGGTNVDTAHDQVLNMITDAVCTEAARLAGGPIAETAYGPADGLGRFDGAAGLNSGYIMLPRTPVIAVDSVVEYQGNNPVTLTEVTPASGGDGYQLNYRTGRLTRVLGGLWNRPFYPGSNNVWVTWRAGRNPIPADIVQATVEWIAAVFRNTQQVGTAKPGAGPAQEFDPSTSTGLLYLGIPNRITRVLASYSGVGVR